MQEKKLISQIEVLGRTIYIRERDLGLHGVEGHFISVDRLIEIEESLDDERKEEVLAHELLHVALEVSGLSSIFGEEWEEAICLLIENVLKTYKTNFLQVNNLEIKNDSEPINHVFRNFNSILIVQNWSYDDI